MKRKRKLRVSLENIFFYVIGIGFLALAKSKNFLKGYSSPKPFSISEIGKCIEYDIRVVDNWLSHLEQYTKDVRPLHGKNILELGPGSDLGIGLYLLSKGASRYNACDVNDLMNNTPYGFYEGFIEKMNGMNCEVSIDFLRNQLIRALDGKMSKLNYIVRKDFNLVSAFGDKTIDLVFSQAAFEHFDDIDATIAQLSAVCKPEALIVAEIDLKTHSRWIRDKDPNNIYRYHEAIYRAFSFRGIPNRIRPYQYQKAFERNGWKDISIVSLSTIESCNSSRNIFTKSFTAAKNQMELLSILLLARR